MTKRKPGASPWLQILLPWNHCLLPSLGHCPVAWESETAQMRALFHSPHSQHVTQQYSKHLSEPTLNQCQHQDKWFSTGCTHESPRVLKKHQNLWKRPQVYLIKSLNDSNMKPELGPTFLIQDLCIPILSEEMDRWAALIQTQIWTQSLPGRTGGSSRVGWVRYGVQTQKMAEDLPHYFSPLGPKGSEKLKNFRPCNRRELVDEMNSRFDLCILVGMRDRFTDGSIP